MLAITLGLEAYVSFAF